MSGSESVAAVETVRPTNLREARDVMLSGRRILIRGAGTAQSWGAPVEPVDVVLDTTGFDQVTAYNPA
ncbi:MAG TPA: hypothetical protein VI076_12205, partial [Actinopolymorphaceae bacterium]